MDVVPVAKSVEDDIMGVLGWVAAVVLVAFMLPMLAFLYLDILEEISLLSLMPIVI